MRFEITLISLLRSVFGAICAGELFLAQLTPHSVYCREPAILSLELHRVRSGVRNAILGRSAEKVNFQKRLAKVLITPVSMLYEILLYAATEQVN
jgi:hypothetical protein